MTTSDHDDHNVIDLTTSGGIATVILAKDFELPVDYDLHPQVHQLLASELSASDREMQQQIPATTKIVLVGGEIPTAKFGTMRTVLSRRRIPFIIRRSGPALADALAKCLPDKKKTNGSGGLATVADVAKTGPKPGQKQAPHGAVGELVRAHADLAKGSAEEARRLMKIAQQQGIPTTVNSLAQAISKAKRHGGRTETPRSIQTAQQKALTTLDDAIAGLQLVRDYVAETERLNLELTSKLNAFRELLAK